jgi:glycosyltransferase involved in cell wall biosynthesis
VHLVIATPEYPPHPTGGIAAFYRALTPALARAGCDVTVVVASPFADDFPAYEHDGVQVRCVPRAAIRARADDMPHLSAAPVFRRWLAAARASRDVVADIDPDCVETTDFGLQAVPFLAAGFPCPVVVQCHGSLGQISEREPRRPEIELDLALARLIEAVVLRLAADVQTYGTANAAEWAGRLGRRVRVLPPPLAAGERAPDEPGAGGLVVARIQSWKGPVVLCDALRQSPDGPSLTWVGRDTETAPDGGSLSAYLARQYPDVWGSRITPVGALSRADVAEKQRRARFAVVPSDWDVFNLAGAEAMRAGRVLIASDGAGVSELIEPGRNGFVFNAGDAGDLASALARVHALSPEEAAEIGRRARATVAAVLAPDVSAAAHLQVVRTLASEPAGAAQAAPDWVQAFVSGHESGRVTAAFLDQMSLRDLSKYLGRRASERLWGRTATRGGRTS